jgi:hypothetical protein
MFNCYYPRLQVLAGTAALREGVRHRLLNGERRLVATEFDLSSQEIEVVMGVEAETIQDFARDLHQRVVQKSTTD